ncbi:hypothetical protein ALC57_17111 [Trachymyrmex cornetzi]|uniref:Uncharacterized protein n=1 Tax=Trachymyrmex cornetzi TaxID=471704 RepID=A0A195DC90_9HYME|nr:hypothetical protein ALC57_17111 [Trachymyrmex cornetzi]
MTRLEEKRLKAVEKRRKIKRKSSRRGENRKGFLLRGAPYQQYRYISHSAEESKFTTRQRCFLILHFLAVGFNVKANAGFPRICCITTRFVFDSSSCCINNALYRIIFSSPLDLPKLKSPELFHEYTYLYLLQHLSFHSFLSVSKDPNLVENFVVVHLALDDFAAFSSFCYSHIFLRMEKDLTYSISIVDEGIIFVISCAQVHVIIILVPFLSHGRGSLRQREIINRLVILAISRSFRRHEPPPTVSYSPVEGTPNRAIDPVCDVVIDDRESVGFFLFCTNAS